jgi:hypothetical protein
MTDLLNQGGAHAVSGERVDGILSISLCLAGCERIQCIDMWLIIIQNWDWMDMLEIKRPRCWTLHLCAVRTWRSDRLRIGHFLVPCGKLFEIGRFEIMGSNYEKIIVSQYLLYPRMVTYLRGAKRVWFPLLAYRNEKVRNFQCRTLRKRTAYMTCLSWQARNKGPFWQVVGIGIDLTKDGCIPCDLFWVCDKSPRSSEVVPEKTTLSATRTRNEKHTVL